MAQPDDVALLRRFEPVLRYNRGERFFPMDVSYYVRECSLWMYRQGAAPRCLVPEGSLTLDRLGAPRRSGFDAVHFLQFIEPLNLTQLARYQIEETLHRREKDPRDVFQAGQGRLARVGYFSRFVETIMSLVFLARGWLPGDTAAAAALTYQRIMERHRHTCYYGRVVRENGWIALQYWFFYPYNNWRSGFFGINDHEADWEQVCVYAYQGDDQNIHPEWVAYASHDYSGDDLRRHWDDPEVEKVGEHPVVYVGAGSHASYFAPGDYLTEIELPFLRPLNRLAERLRQARNRALEEYQGVQAQPPDGGAVNIFYIPYVDYARGDGHGVGPGEERQWDEPRLLDPVPDWVLLYRGLWGNYTRDPFSSEDAPAGPMYERDGSVRRAWYDPLGWAGLDRVSPPVQALERAFAERSEILNRRDDLQSSIDAMSEELLRLGVELEAMRGLPHLKPLYEEHGQRIADLRAELDEARANVTRDEALLDAVNEYIDRLRAGDRGPLRVHISRAFNPIDDEDVRLGRVAELWAAISIGLMGLVFVALVLFDRQSLWLGVAIMAALILFIEAAFRRWLGRLLTVVTVILAIVAGVILISEFWEPMVIGLVIIVAVYILLDNLRELWA